MKKKILVAALCVAIAAVVACGSLAYFTATDSATNKFMTATYEGPDQPDPDEIFNIEVIENGTPTAGDGRLPGTETEKGLEYEDIIPGAKYAKKVTVKNTGDYSAYVRVKVTITKAGAWRNYFGASENILVKLASSVDTTNWLLAGNAYDQNSDTVTYIYNYKTAVAADASTSALFDTIVIPVGYQGTSGFVNFGAEEMAAVDGFEVQITADAIQSDYTGTVNQAFGIFDTIYAE